MNERQRDRYGRPLKDSSKDAYPSVPDRGSISSGEAWSQALEYLESDLPFHAHEVFEQRWRSCPKHERLAWQALAQWAAALTHQARGNSKGAKAVAHRAKENLKACETLPVEIDETHVLDSLDQLLGR